MEKHYSPEAVAKNLDVHLKTVYNWIHSGKLKAVKAGHFWRISESSLQEFLTPPENE